MKTTIKTGNKRLLKLADFLQKLPRKRFDYRTWVGWGWKGKQDLSCGTTGCALGWAATMPAFRKLGLRLFKSRALGYALVTDSQGNTHETAAKGVFTLTDDEAYHLFVPGTNENFATPKYVAKKIRKFVKVRGDQHHTGLPLPE